MTKLLKILFAAFPVLFSSISQAERPTQLRMGVALPLTGVAAAYGSAYRNGLELGMTDNPAFKDRITFIFEDHQYDTKQALKAVQKLDKFDRVDLIYVWGFTPSDAVAPVYKSIKAPLLVASINPVSRGKATVLNIESPMTALLKPLEVHLSKENHPRVAFVATQLGALVQSAEILKGSIPPNSLVSTDTLDASVTDFRTIITRLKNKNISVLGLFVAPGQMELFIKQSRELAFNPVFFGGNTFNDASVIEMFKETKDGPIFSDSYLDEAFAHRYEEVFHDSSHIAEAARGYFLAKLLTYLVQHAATYSPQKIIECLHTFPSGQGPAGSYHLLDDDFGWHVDFKPVLNRIEYGRLKKIQ